VEVDMPTTQRKPKKQPARKRQAAGRTPANSLPAIRALVRRQAQAWERDDFDLGAADWLPNGMLVSPGGQWTAAELREEMAKFHAGYTDLNVDIRNVFVSADGRKVAIEWDWTVTRRADGARSVTHDAIIADLQRGKIKSWREYFDLGSSVEALAPGQPLHVPGSDTCG
jgi:uncharacterized protein (TIGR02246 family)